MIVRVNRYPLGDAHPPVPCAPFPCRRCKRRCGLHPWHAVSRRDRITSSDRAGTGRQAGPARCRRSGPEGAGNRGAAAKRILAATRWPGLVGHRNRGSRRIEAGCPDDDHDQRRHTVGLKTGWYQASPPRNAIDGKPGARRKQSCGGSVRGTATPSSVSIWSETSSPSSSVAVARWSSVIPET